MLVNVEQLIQEVEARPLLWNHSMTDHTNKGKRRDAWRDVCRSICSEFDEKDEVEKSETEKVIQRKWKSLRDCFSRDLKMNRQGLCKRRKYLYHHQLSFLESVRGTFRSNYRSWGNDDTMNTTAANSTNSGDHHEWVRLESPKSSVEISDGDSWSPVAFSSADGTQNSAATINDDEDVLFALCVVKELKKIPEPQKLSVKIDMMQVLANARGVVPEHE